METKAEIYIPAVFRSFQGFQIKDIREWRESCHMEFILESQPNRQHYCFRCGSELGRQRDRYWLRSRHLRAARAFWRRFVPRRTRVY